MVAEDIIIKPIITEKSNMDMQDGKYNSWAFLSQTPGNPGHSAPPESVEDQSHRAPLPQ